MQKGTPVKNRRDWLADLLCGFLVGALSLLAACFYFRCYSSKALAQPWYTFNDVPLMQAYSKVAAEGDALPWKPRMVTRLNAPFLANWCDFPTPEELIWDFSGLLSNWFGVIAGYNLSQLLPGSPIARFGSGSSCLLLGQFLDGKISLGAGYGPHQP